MAFGGKTIKKAALDGRSRPTPMSKIVLFV